jgi:hypothetical protein
VWCHENYSECQRATDWAYTFLHGLFMITTVEILKLCLTLLVISQHSTMFFPERFVGSHRCCVALDGIEQ